MHRGLQYFSCMCMFIYSAPSSLRGCVSMCVCVLCVIQHADAWISGVQGGGLGALRADGVTESRGQFRAPKCVTTTLDCRFVFVRMCICAYVCMCVSVSLSMHVFLPHALTPPLCDF